MLCPVLRVSPVATMSMIVALRRLTSSIGLPRLVSSSVGCRSFAAHSAVPPQDASLDHVFGCNETVVDFNFEPNSTLQTFLMSSILLSFMSVPVLLMIEEDWNVQDVKARIAAARAAKESAAAE